MTFSLIAEPTASSINLCKRIRHSRLAVSTYHFRYYLLLLCKAKPRVPERSAMRLRSADLNVLQSQQSRLRMGCWTQSNYRSQIGDEDDVVDILVDPAFLPW